MTGAKIIKRKISISLGIFLFCTIVNVIVCIGIKAPTLSFVFVEAFIGVCILTGTLIGMAILLKKEPLELNDEREIMLAKQANHIALQFMFSFSVLGLLAITIYSYISGIRMIEIPIGALNILILFLVLLYLGIRFATSKIIR